MTYMLLRLRLTGLERTHAQDVDNPAIANSTIGCRLLFSCACCCVRCVSSSSCCCCFSSCTYRASCPIPSLLIDDGFNSAKTFSEVIADDVVVAAVLLLLLFLCLPFFRCFSASPPAATEGDEGIGLLLDCCCAKCLLDIERESSSINREMIYQLVRSGTYCTAEREMGDWKPA